MTLTPVPASNEQALAAAKAALDDVLSPTRIFLRGPEDITGRWLLVNKCSQCEGSRPQVLLDLSICLEGTDAIWPMEMPVCLRCIPDILAIVPDSRTEVLTATLIEGS
jgi:hypothetical protein